MHSIKIGSKVDESTWNELKALAGMAAALFKSLIMNRPFVDGNKRVA